MLRYLAAATMLAMVCLAIGMGGSSGQVSVIHPLATRSRKGASNSSGARATGGDVVLSVRGTRRCWAISSPR